MLGDLTKNQVRTCLFRGHVLKPGAPRIMNFQVFSDSKHEKAVRGRLKSEVGAWDHLLSSSSMFEVILWALCLFLTPYSKYRFCVWVHLPSSSLLASGDQAVEQGGGGHLRRTQLHQRVQVATIGNKYYLSNNRQPHDQRAPIPDTSCTAQAKPVRRRSALCIATSASKIARGGTRRGRTRWRGGTRRCWRRWPWGSKWLRNVFP